MAGVWAVVLQLKLILVRCWLAATRAVQLAGHQLVAAAVFAAAWVV
jgi:hypothetical protein